MATYKVIQDIEAEDHILGPLTLRQFIFALISVFCFYICFILLTKGVAFLLILFFPPAVFFGFFAIPFGRDQPTEIWVLAKLRFFLKPRHRIWDQSGVKELVTITVPKKIEHVLTNGLSQYEVQSRLNVLAKTLDSRGWAIKNANLGMSPLAYPATDTSIVSDRLIDVSNVPNSVPDEEVPVGADVLDENTSPVGQNFDKLMSQSSQAHHKQLVQQMNAPAQQVSPPINNNSQWFTPQINNNPSPISAPAVLAHDASPDEVALAERLKEQHQAQQVYSSNLRTIQPMTSQAVPNSLSSIQSSQTTSTALTDQSDPAILSLANNNDFTVDTIAREAKRAKDDESGQGEVVIPLR